ncbi:MAG: PrgI family protein [Chloroflexota bacterium]|nr:MAG: PrgI family protein [Chloroflexota bacterium]
MQQWIPRGHTLEPKIWGEVGLRQALYIGLGVLCGILFLFALSPFGLVVRVGGLILPPCLGAVVGFLRIKGLMPERYLFHRLRFRLRRAGTLGVWETAVSMGLKRDIWLRSAPATEERVTPEPAPARPIPKPVSHRPSASAPVAYVVEAGAFGFLFTLVAWAVASGMLSYAARGVLP